MPAPSSSPRPSSGRRLLRRLLYVLALLVVLALGLPVLVSQIIGQDRLRALAEETLTDALGRRVTIEGRVALTPWLSLSIGALRMADAPEFGPGPMLEAARTEVSVRLLPLFGKVVALSSVRVRGLVVHARRDAAGRTNWEDLAASGRSDVAAPSGWRVLPQPGGIRVTEASLDYQDALTGRRWSIADARLTTGHGQPCPFSLFFRARGLLPATEIEGHAQGGAILDPDSGRLTPQAVQLNLGLTRAEPLVAGGAGPVSLSVRATLDSDPATGILGLSGIEARLPGARLTGSARIDNPGLAAWAAETELSLAVDTDGGWRDILGLTPGAPPASLTAQGGGEGVAQPAVVPGERLSAPVGTEAGQAVLRLNARADASGITVGEAELGLPGGQVTARGALRFDEARPGLDLAVSAENVDFGAMPLPTGRDAWVLPTAWLSGLLLDARFDVRSCRLAGLSIRDFHATATGRDGRLRLYPVSAVLESGVASLDARLDATREALGFDARLALDPTPGEGQAVPGTSRVRLQGKVEPSGAQGTLHLTSPDIDALGRMLGLGTTGPAGAALECRGVFNASPGASRPLKRLALTDLEARVGGAVLHGQAAFSGESGSRLSFDLAADTLDLSRLGGLTGPGGGGNGGGVRLEGKLKADRLVLRGFEARNAQASLSLAEGRLEVGLAGADLYGGRLTGKAEADPSGRLNATLHLAGAEAAKLPGNLGLTGAVTAKLGAEAALAKGRWRLGQASLEAEAPQLGLGTGPDRSLVESPRLTLALTGRETQNADDALAFDANVTLASPGMSGLREVRLTLQAPLALDKAGRLREAGPARIEAGALARTGTAGGRVLRLGLTGPVSIDWAGGGFTAGDLRLDVGGVVATARLWRKAGESGPTNFSLDTGPRPPRQALADWGLTLPKGLAADRLTRGSLALSGTCGEAGCDISRLVLVLDDTTLTGRVGLPRFDPRRARFDLNLDRLDWDAYFPVNPGAPPEDRHRRLDLEWLRNLSLEARINVGWLKKGNVTFDAAAINLAARGGSFTYRQESPRFYGGRFFAEIRGDVRDGALHAGVELKLEGFECARFLRDWAEGDTLDSGAATFILAARTAGASEAELRGAIAGNAKLQITRGALKVKESGQKSGEHQAAESVPFDVFSSTWVSREGVARSEDFVIDSPRMQVRGRGHVDLRDESINLAVTAALPGDREAQATIIGPLDNPKLTVDRGKMVGDFVYRIIQGIVSIPGKTLSHILQIR